MRSKYHTRGSYKLPKEKTQHGYVSCSSSSNSLSEFIINEGDSPFTEKVYENQSDCKRYSDYIFTEVSAMFFSRKDSLNQSRSKESQIKILDNSSNYCSCAGGDANGFLPENGKKFEKEREGKSLKQRVMEKLRSNSFFQCSAMNISSLKSGKSSFVTRRKESDVKKNHNKVDVYAESKEQTRNQNHSRNSGGLDQKPITGGYFLKSLEVIKKNNDKNYISNFPENTRLCETNQQQKSSDHTFIKLETVTDIILKLRKDITTVIKFDDDYSSCNLTILGKVEKLEKSLKNLVTMREGQIGRSALLEILMAKQKELHTLLNSLRDEVFQSYIKLSPDDKYDVARRGGQMGCIFTLLGILEREIRGTFKEMKTEISKNNLMKVKTKHKKMTKSLPILKISENGSSEEHHNSLIPHEDVLTKLILPSPVGSINTALAPNLTHKNISKEIKELSDLLKLIKQFFSPKCDELKVYYYDKIKTELSKYELKGFEINYVKDCVIIKTPYNTTFAMPIHGHYKATGGKSKSLKDLINSTLAFPSEETLISNNDVKITSLKSIPPLLRDKCRYESESSIKVIHNISSNIEQLHLESTNFIDEVNNERLLEYCIEQEQLKNFSNLSNNDKLFEDITSRQLLNERSTMFNKESESVTKEKYFVKDYIAGDNSSSKIIKIKNDLIDQTTVSSNSIICTKGENSKSRRKLGTKNTTIRLSERAKYSSMNFRDFEENTSYYSVSTEPSSISLAGSRYSSPASDSAISVNTSETMYTESEETVYSTNIHNTRIISIENLFTDHFQRYTRKGNITGTANTSNLESDGQVFKKQLGENMNTESSSTLTPRSDLMDIDGLVSYSSTEWGETVSEVSSTLSNCDPITVEDNYLVAMSQLPCRINKNIIH